MRVEVLLSVSAQDVDTSGYQISDLDDVEFYWENDELEVDAVIRPRIDDLSSLLFFNDIVMGSMAENSILIDEEQNKENSPPLHPTTPVSERPTQHPMLTKKCPLGTRIENVPDYLF